MPRFSANLGFLWRDLPVLERIARARAAGFEAVEFHYPYDVPAEAIRDALKAHSLAGVSINTRLGDLAAGELGLAALPGREAEARAAIDEAIGCARIIGLSAVHVLAGRFREENPAARAVFLAALDHAAQAAESAGLIVVIEPINQRDAPGYFLKSVEHVAEILGELGRPNAKMLFDCYHAQIAGGDLTRRIEQFLPLIGHIQIAAVPTRHEPDEGEVAYERLLKTIDALGYQGFIGAEYIPRSGVEAGLGWMKAFALEERDYSPPSELRAGDNSR